MEVRGGGQGWRKGHWGQPQPCPLQNFVVTPSLFFTRAPFGLIPALVFCQFSILHHTPYNLQARPQTSNTEPQTPGPTPQIPNFKPQTPNHKPQTPNPKPQTQNPKSRTRSTEHEILKTNARRNPSAGESLAQCVRMQILLDVQGVVLALVVRQKYQSLRRWQA